MRTDGDKAIRKIYSKCSKSDKMDNCTAIILKFWLIKIVCKIILRNDIETDREMKTKIETKIETETKLVTKLERRLHRNIGLDYIACFLQNLNMQNCIWVL